MKEAVLSSLIGRRNGQLQLEWDTTKAILKLLFMEFALGKYPTQ